jgi:hypothetical protein
MTGGEPHQVWETPCPTIGARNVESARRKRNQSRRTFSLLASSTAALGDSCPNLKP